MLAPERRTRWDLIAAALLAAAIIAVSAVLWWVSDARRTVVTSAPGTTTVTGTGSGANGQTSPTGQLPSALTEAWRAPSLATPVPLASTGTVVTAAEGMVAGRDLRSGAIRWSYRRDRPLCTVTAALSHVVAVYQRGETCSEVTTLEWTSGLRGAQRTGPVEAPTRLVAAGNLLAASGRRYLEVWRSDLVRTLAYGRLPTPAQPGTQPRPECLHGSLALSSTPDSRVPGGAGPGGSVAAGAVNRLAVVERCPGERPRLTVQRPDPKEPEVPEVTFSVLLPGQQARVVAVRADRAAVALPDPARLVVLDELGKTVAEHPLAVPDADLRGDPPAGLVELTETPTTLSWFTGSVTVALDTADLRPRWVRPGSLGAGTEVAGRLLVPVSGALAVLDTSTGDQISALPVDRGDYRGPVIIASSSGVILEQRGDTLVALR